MYHTQWGPKRPPQGLYADSTAFCFALMDWIYAFLPLSDTDPEALMQHYVWKKCWTSSPVCIEYKFCPQMGLIITPRINDYLCFFKNSQHPVNGLSNIKTLPLSRCFSKIAEGDELFFSRNLRFIKYYLSCSFAPQRKRRGHLLDLWETTTS